MTYTLLLQDCTFKPASESVWRVWQMLEPIFFFSFLLSESPRQALDLVEFRYALQTRRIKGRIKALSNVIRVDQPSHSISPMKSTLGELNLPLTRNWKKNKNNLKFSGGELNFPSSSAPRICHLFLFHSARSKNSQSSDFFSPENLDKFTYVQEK